MDKLLKLERRWGRWAIPHLTLWVMVGQIFVFGMEALNEIGSFKQFPIDALYLIPAKVLEGEIWRWITFVFLKPITAHPFWLIVAWGIFYLTGSALENAWGDFKYTIFILIYIFSTVIVSMLMLFIYPKIAHPSIVISNFYLLECVFLAFAYLNPNIEFRLYFVLPVKVKWLGILALAYLGYQFVLGDTFIRLLILASVVNLIAFFGKDVFMGFKNRQRRIAHQREASAHTAVAFHTCTVCGATDKSHPDRDFFYQDGDGYCEACQEQVPD